MGFFSFQNYTEQNSIGGHLFIYHSCDRTGHILHCQKEDLTGPGALCN